MKQTSFWKNPEKSHGARKGRRKCARPIATKKPMHVIVKSSRARGAWNMQLFADEIEGEVFRVAKKFDVKIHSYQNVCNHLHLGVQARTREGFRSFLRVFTQAIVFLVTGAKKGNPIGKFWDSLAYSRIVEWGRDWNNLGKYFEKNYWQSRGIPRDVVDYVFAQDSS